ncbi:MAG: hypothetical protein U9R25_05455 [Chloroflexota bacterium]|nr:hypothetical protein [Chloroflexota bacterium]
MIALKNEARELGEEQRPEPAIDRLDEIQVPLLAVIGDLDDPDLVAASEFLANNVTGAELATIPGTAHLPNMEQPEVFNQHLQEFLNGMFRQGSS